MTKMPHVLSLHLERMGDLVAELKCPYAKGGNGPCRHDGECDVVTWFDELGVELWDERTRVHLRDLEVHYHYEGEDGPLLSLWRPSE